MINKRIRHLPVMKDNKLIGIVSIGDIVNAVLDQKSFMIDQLFTYIHGIPVPEK
jgi:CBS domain-containing protein